MKISGRDLAYLLIIAAVVLFSGITLTGAQGFPSATLLPVPVEENGIVEIVRRSGTISLQTNDCPRISVDVYQVPSGKRLIIEHVTAANYRRVGRSLSPSWIHLKARSDILFEGASSAIAFSREGFPISGGGPITFYAEPGETVGFELECPRGTRANEAIEFTNSITGRLVPHPHPSTIPTATPPPPFP